MNLMEIKEAFGLNGDYNLRNFLQTMNKQKLFVVMVSCCLLFASTETSLACKKKNKQTAQKVPVVKSIKFSGYEGRLYPEKRLIELEIGPIGGNSQMMKYCEEIAEAAFRQYPEYTKCKIFWDIQSMTETVFSYFLFERTEKGVKRIG